MMGFQAAGAAPIVLGHPVEYPQTIATAIRIGNPASWQSATSARDESSGVIQSVTDDEILAAYRMMASREGVFGEPASAAPLAGIIKLRQSGFNFSGKSAVCIVTGSGLKDPDIPIKFAQPFPELPADEQAIEQALGLR
jgi:threonine synthase